MGGAGEGTVRELPKVNPFRIAAAGRASWASGDESAVTNQFHHLKLRRVEGHFLGRVESARTDSGRR